MGRVLSEGRKGDAKELYRRVAVALNDCLAAEGLKWTVPVGFRNEDSDKRTATWAANILLSRKNFPPIPSVIADTNEWYKRISEAINKVATS